jgi:hypothetical protein
MADFLCFLSYIIFTVIFNRCKILKWFIGEVFIVCPLHRVCATDWELGSVEVLLVCPFACFISRTLELILIKFDIHI